jgi:hypothetical protein
LVGLVVGLGVLVAAEVVAAGVATRGELAALGDGLGIETGAGAWPAR